jgi:DNA-binding XRE family transcriptional regulator
MKSGKLFENALKKAGIDLHPGDEFKVRVKKKGNHLELVVDNSNLSSFEHEILKRSSRTTSPTKPYKPKISTGERIRSFRKAAGLSLSALAEKTGISKGSLGSIENGERSAGLNVLKRIAEALEIDVSILVN